MSNRSGILSLIFLISSISAFSQLNKNDSVTLRSSTENYFLFKTAGTFHYEWLNQPSNSFNYNSRYAKALNSGIYFVDMLYVTSHDQAQELLIYLKTEKVLLDDLSLFYFEKSELDRTFVNLGKTDSLLKIFSSLKPFTDKNFKISDSVGISFLSNIGSNVEAMYLFCKDAGGKLDRKGKKKLINEGKTFLEVEKVLAGDKDPEHDELKRAITVLRKLTENKMTKTNVSKFIDELTVLRNKIITP